MERLTLGMETSETREGQTARILDSNGEVLAQACGRSSRLTRIRLEFEVRSALQFRARSRDKKRHVLGCSDGTVLLLTFDPEAGTRGSWGYAICGPGRKSYAGACGFSGSEGEESALVYVRKHAADSYGGVAWEQRF